MYYIYGDTPQTGSMVDCGGAFSVKVMCEEIGEGYLRVLERKMLNYWFLPPFSDRLCCHQSIV